MVGEQTEKGSIWYNSTWVFSTHVETTTRMEGVLPTPAQNLYGRREIESKLRTMKFMHHTHSYIYSCLASVTYLFANRCVSAPEGHEYRLALPLRLTQSSSPQAAGAVLRTTTVSCLWTPPHRQIQLCIMYKRLRQGVIKLGGSDKNKREK